MTKKDSEKLKAAYCRGYNDGKNDMLALLKWFNKWRDRHPDSPYEEAEAELLATPILEIYDQR